MGKDALIPHEDSTGKFGYIDAKHNWIIDPKFDHVWEFEDDVAWVEVNKKFGLINQQGIFLAEPQFDNVSDFFGGYTKVKVDNKWGLINSQGQLVIIPRFDWIYGIDIEDHLLFAEADRKNVITNLKGENVVIPGATFKLVKAESGLLGLADSEGNWLYTPRFTNGFEWEGMFMVEINEGWVVIKSNGKWVQTLYDYIKQPESDQDFLEAQFNGNPCQISYLGYIVEDDFPFPL